MYSRAMSSSSELAERIGSRQVYDFVLAFVEQEYASLLIDSLAGPVPDMLIHSSEEVEDRGLADIGLPGKRDPIGRVARLGGD